MTKINKITLSGVSYDVEDASAQQSLNSKANKSHTHNKSDITDLSLDWSKIENKPTKLSQFTNDNNFITKEDLKATILINLQTEYGDASDLIGATVKVVADGTTLLNTTWQGRTSTVQVAMEATYTVEVGAVTDYYLPISSTSGIAAPGVTYLHTFNYQTEMVTVTVTGCEDKQPTIAINGKNYTWTGTAIKAKVATNTSYQIIGFQVNQFQAPIKGFTAINGTRSVVLEYSTANGVYIASTDGTFILPENWNTSNNTKALGVAVFSDNCHFIIAPEDACSSTCWWGTPDTELSGATNTSIFADAIADFNGETNTEAIIAEDSATNKAADYCKAYTFKNGKSGYLPAFGELYVAYQNRSALATALATISGEAFQENFYWSSTQYGSEHAWSALGRWLHGRRL